MRTLVLTCLSAAGKGTTQPHHVYVGCRPQGAVSVSDDATKSQSTFMYLVITKPPTPFRQTYIIQMHAHLSSRIQEPLQRLIVQRSKQLITQIRSATSQQTLKVLKRRIEVQPVR